MKPTEIAVGVSLVLLLLFVRLTRNSPSFRFLHRAWGRRLTEAEQWAVAASGNLAGPNGHHFDRLPFAAERVEVRRMLEYWWSIRSKADLLATLDDLETEGHSGPFEVLHKHLARSIARIVSHGSRRNPQRRGSDCTTWPPISTPSKTAASSPGIRHG